MAEKKFDDSNRGSIWKNDKKEKDTHPDFTGSANVGGHDYWVNAWRRKEGASDRAPALSFSFKLKDGKPAHGSAPKPTKSAREEMDDEIPF